MKTLKRTTVALCLVLAYGTSFAFQMTSVKHSMPVAVNAYIDAVAYGKTDHLDEIIDSRAVFTISNGSRVQSYNKKEVIDLIKSTKAVQQNCETSFKVLDSNEKRASVKVLYKYENFIRVDNITMSGTKNGWKITRVASSYI